MLDVALSVKYLLKRDPSLKELFYNPPIENLYPESNFFSIDNKIDCVSAIEWKSCKKNLSEIY